MTNTWLNFWESCSSFLFWLKIKTAIFLVNIYNQGHWTTKTCSFICMTINLYSIARSPYGLLVLQKYKINKGKKKETKNICSIGFQLYTNAADHETDFVVWRPRQVSLRTALYVTIKKILILENVLGIKRSVGSFEKTGLWPAGVRYGQKAGRQGVSRWMFTRVSNGVIIRLASWKVIYH